MNKRTRSPYCVNGHLFTEQNTYIYLSTGYRSCKECSNQSHKRYRASRKEIWPAVNKRGFDNLYFGGNREKAVQRDGEKCVKCGMTRDEHKEKYGFDITVDHIDMMGRYKPKELRNNSMENLQTLCISCHAKKDTKLRRELKEAQRK